MIRADNMIYSIFQKKLTLDMSITVLWTSKNKRYEQTFSYTSSKQRLYALLRNVYYSGTR